MLLWEVDNLQITTSRVQSFEDRGIFIENESTLVLTQQARDNVMGGAYQVQCLVFNSVTLNGSLSDPVFVNVFGPPDPVINLDVAPSSSNSVLIIWDPPPNTLPEVSLDYIITITNISGSRVEVTTDTLLEVRDMGGTCQEFVFEVIARNEAGNSSGVTITESIPISPDLTDTDASLTIVSVDINSSTSAEISVSFERATSCSPNFSVANHTVLVMGEDGEVVRAVLADSAPTGPLQVTVGGLARDAVFTVRVVACNVLICRQSIALDLLTTDVQNSTALFFETFVLFSCSFGSGSVALGCVLTLELEGGQEMGRERFFVERQSDSSVVASLCNRTDNSRMAYQVISAVDWESDGTEGSVSIPVLASVTVDEGEFPCPTDEVGGDGLSGGAIAGIVIGTTFFVILVAVIVVVVVVFCYHRTRDVKKKSNGAISIDEKALLPSTERRNAPSLNASPFTSLPVSTTRRIDSTEDPTPYESTTMKSTSSLPARSLQSSLDCGPVGELRIPSGKKGKIHMHIWSDTLERCKRTGKKTFALLPLLEDMEPQPEASDM
jgi:hypothetical protein